MSFTSTPLGNGRRLDKPTFFGKQPSAGTITRPAPASYAHGAPTAGSRSPTQSSKSLKPEKWSVKDTSVNIATAFQQAAADQSMSNSAAWASGSKPTSTVPRSTSVEFEQQTHSGATSRRLAPPPGRNGPRPPTSTSSSIRSTKPSSVRYVPGEDSQPTRGKSPSIVDGLTSLARSASFYVRQRSVEPQQDTSASYSYEKEEAAFQNQSASRPQAVRKVNTAQKRTKMSVDNKAYQPSRSDEETESDYSEDDSRRMKKKKKDGGGPLTTLPVASYDKKKKRRKSGKGGAADEEQQRSGGEQELTPQQLQPQRSIPAPRAPSLPPAPPPQPDQRLMDDDTMEDMEIGLQSIPEMEEEPQVSGEVSHDSILSQQPQKQQQTSRPKPRGGIGAVLGKVVHPFYAIIVVIGNFLLRVIAVTGWVLGRLVHGLYTAPKQWLQSHNVLPAATVLIALLVLPALWKFRGLFLPSRGGNVSYLAPNAPPANIDEYADQLQRLQTAFSDLLLDNQRIRAQQDLDARQRVELVDELESVKMRGRDTVKEVASVHRKLDVANHEVERLGAELKAQASIPAPPPPVPATPPSHASSSDEEARAKIKDLEVRIGSVEGVAKEASELSKNSMAKAVAAVGSAGASSSASSAHLASAAWWNKLATGARSGLTIKTSDGTDVTSLISHLVDSALSQYSKDTVGKRDFALYSGGAQVIPSLTSPTFEVKPSNTFGVVLGALTGSGYAMGRPPVTALHHEIHNGNCWPFKGTKGQLGVVLAAPTFISDITIDHVPKENAYDMRSTPREMELWALVEGKNNLEKILQWESSRSEDASVLPETPSTLPKGVKYIRVASFAYDINAPNHVQTFPADPDIRALGVDFGIVVLMMNNNWGQDQYTCLYRLRVHGERAMEVPAPWSPVVEVD